MSSAITHPAALATAAGHVNPVGSVLAAQTVAAAAATTGQPPAASDELSALTSTQFSADATLYQAVRAQATANHELFTSALGASATSYAAAENANTIATS